VYTQTTLTESADAAQYAESEFMRAYVELKRHPLYAKLETGKARYLLQRAQAHRRGLHTVLDIGASTGAVMAASGLQGLNGYGVEPDRAMAEPLGRLHPQRFVNGYFPQDLPAAWPQFDLITLLDVLEHMVEPVSFLQSVKSSLAPEGLLLIQVPNFNSLLVQLDGPVNSNFCVGHWQHFTAETLSDVLARAGFRAVEIGNCISELDRIQAFPAEKVRATTERLLGVAKTVETPAQLYEYGLGYKLYGLFAPIAQNST
jgi:2-polyprenyl-3-methyl-5-hydroxy-6-metoxy-1,4-benzoquinol methylase